MTATTTDFILNGNEYFAANLNNGWVRVGLTGYIAYDFPPGHPKFSRVALITTEDEAENIVDESFMAYGPAIIYV